MIHGLESKPEKQIYERGGPSSHAAQDRGCKNVAPPLGMALRTCERLVSFSAPAGNKPKLVEGQQSSVNIPRAIQWRLRPSPMVFSLPTCVCVCVRACACGVFQLCFVEYCKCGQGALFGPVQPPPSCSQLVLKSGTPKKPRRNDWSGFRVFLEGAANPSDLSLPAVRKVFFFC